MCIVVLLKLRVLSFPVSLVNSFSSYYSEKVKNREHIFINVIVRCSCMSYVCETDYSVTVMSSH